MEIEAIEMEVEGEVMGVEGEVMEGMGSETRSEGVIDCDHDEKRRKKLTGKSEGEKKVKSSQQAAVCFLWQDEKKAMAVNKPLIPTTIHFGWVLDVAKQCGW
jgi:ABC-type dipeptide/oligopeptide/nickel transport system ATPase subunit